MKPPGETTDNVAGLLTPPRVVTVILVDPSAAEPCYSPVYQRKNGSVKSLHDSGSRLVCAIVNRELMIVHLVS